MSTYPSGKIKDLLAQGVLDPMTRLVLVNAIYFKGLWNKQFKQDQTQDAQFRVNKVIQQLHEYCWFYFLYIIYPDSVCGKGLFLFYFKITWCSVTFLATPLDQIFLLAVMKHSKKNTLDFAQSDKKSLCFDLADKILELHEVMLNRLMT